jgi:two-component system LytT family response regulator
MLKSILIDDEVNNVELMSNLIRLYGGNVSIVATADSVGSGYEKIMEHKPDVVFLDVEMQDGTGFDLLTRLGTIDFKVIFVTAHEQYAIDAFRFCALDYLLKPVAPAQLIAALEKAQQAINKTDQDAQLKALLNNLSQQAARKKKMVFKTLERIYTVNINEIIRMESDGSYTSVYLTDGKKILVSRLLKEFDVLLSAEGFLRVHQSHLVNMEFVFCFEKQQNHIVMQDESIVPVSSRKKEYVLNLLNGG